MTERALDNGVEGWKERDRTRKRKEGMEPMDGNLRKKNTKKTPRMVVAVTRLLSLLLFGSEML